VIEHPEYIPAKMREKMDIRGGADRGRIYRVMPKAGIEAPRRALARMEARGWVGELAGPNQWRRMTAQRLLVEGRRVEVDGLLVRMLTAHTNPVARVHALWTLAGLGLLSDSQLLGALADADSRVVENAVTAAETRAQRGGAVEARLRDLATTHSQVRVRFLAALAVTLPAIETARALVRDGAEEWMRRAVLTALAEGEVKVLAQLLESVRSGDANRVAAPAAVRAVADLTGARAGADGLLEVLVAGRGVAQDWVRALLEGLASGLARRSERLQAGSDVAEAIEGYARAMDAADRPLAWRLGLALGLAPSASQLEAMRAARQVVTDGTAAPAERRVALQLLALAPAPEDVALALGLFDGQTPAEVQSAALGLVRGPTDAAIARRLLERWRGVHVSLRRDVTQLLLRKRDYHEVLLDGIENGRVKTGELNLDLEDRRRLLRWSVPAVQERAARLLGDGEYGNRQEKVEAWLARLPRTGDRERGREVFERLCASCHRASGIGHEVGPDLTGQAHRSVEDLVSNILDPNMAINPSYVATEVETKDGELVAGIVVAETPEAITLMQAQGVRTTLSRERIRRVETAGASLMPEGLEAGLEPQALRDLVAFMQGR
jgi:putative heme-binding domain-containing protein